MGIKFSQSGVKRHNMMQYVSLALCKNVLVDVEVGWTCRALTNNSFADRQILKVSRSEYIKTT